jgi:hypothetical protein
MAPEPYHQVRADMALALIADGNVPAEFCSEQDPNVPSRASSVERWARADATFASKLKEAKATGAMVMLSQCKLIADDATIRADQKRWMIETRMKIAAIWNPIECIVPKHNNDAPTGINALLHLPFSQLTADQQAEVNRFFGICDD